MQRLKGAFALHMGCPGMRLYHHVRVPSLPFCRQGREPKQPEGYSNDTYTTTMFPRAGFSRQSFCKQFSLIRHHDQHVLTGTVTPFHTLNHPHVYHQGLTGAISLYRQEFPRREKNNRLNLLRELATLSFELCL